MPRAAKSWMVRSLRSGSEWEGRLVAYWEVALDPVSDDYTPREIGARELFRKWEASVHEKYPDGLVPIYWCVQCNERGVFEQMPFQFQHIPGSHREDYLTFFTWPMASATGERLNWLALPVADKLWSSRRADKGGFIQEATGWKPAILQPYAYLPSLSSALR